MPVSPTAAQSAASRTNGAQSRGPVTAEGQAAAARNATRWNLTGPFRLLPGEDAAKLAAIRAAYEGRMAPQDAAEEHWLDELVAAIWRQRRLRDVEAALHAATMAGWDLKYLSLPSFTSLARYRSRIERDLRLAQGELAALRESRPRAAAKPADLPAQKLRQEAARPANDLAQPVPAPVSAARTIEPEHQPAEWLRLAALG